MKRILLLIALFSTTSFAVNAQITINDTDLFAIGFVVEQALDTLPVGISIGSGGGAQTWDFSSLSPDVIDTISFVDPSTLPGSSNFPSSNIGRVDAGNSDYSIFITKNSSVLSLDGVYINLAPFFVREINETLLTFPSTMGTTFAESTNAFLYGYPVGVDPDGPTGPLPYIDSVKITLTTNANSMIDAWGDVTSPFGTFTSLRQIITKEAIDSTFTKVGGVWGLMTPPEAVALGLGNSVEYDTTRTARWWTDDHASQFNLLEMDYEGDGTVNTVYWQKSALTVGVDEFYTQQINVFPNPTSSSITIQTAENIESITIFNSLGKLVQQESTGSFSVDNLARGIYIIHVNSKDGIIRSKFVKE